MDPREIRDYAAVAMAGLLTATMLFLAGWWIWRDLKTERELSSFRQHMTERVDMARWEAEADG